MKKYSRYFWMTQLWAVLFAVFAVMCYYMTAPGSCAVMCTLSFIGWYAGVMAPDDEKYQSPKGRINKRGLSDEAMKEKWGK